MELAHLHLCKHIMRLRAPRVKRWHRSCTRNTKICQKRLATNLPVMSYRAKSSVILIKLPLLVSGLSLKVRAMRPNSNNNLKHPQKVLRRPLLRLLHKRYHLPLLSLQSHQSQAMWLAGYLIPHPKMNQRD